MMVKSQMGETNVHKYLKLLGIKYLDLQGCKLIATEIYVRKSASDDWINEDQKLIETLEKYSHPNYNEWEHHMVDETRKGDDTKWIVDVLGIGEKNVVSYGRKTGTETLLRGVEVKVSRNDFKNGYCQSGLNYHYVLCPELLIKKSEVPKHMGLLYWEGGKADFIYCAKKPKKMELNKNMVDYYRESIYRRYHSQIMGMTREQTDLLRERL